MTRRLCVLALALYPHAWRVRYGAEMRALLDARGPSLSALVDLARGALHAHLRPGGLTGSPRQRMRGTVWATLVCFATLGLLGGGFAKATEDAPFRAAGSSHPLLAGSRAALAALAVACLIVIAFAGAPLAYAVFRQAWRERTPALVRAISSAAVVVGVLIAAVGTLAVLARHHPGSSAGVRQVGAAFVVVVVAVAVVCAIAARVALMKTRFHAAQLVLGVVGAWLLARLMVALTAADAVYTVSLAVDSPSLAASPNGPFDLATKLVLALQLAGMAAASALAVLTTRRGRAALVGD